MAILNKYNLYTIGLQSSVSFEDEVDEYLGELRKINEYDEVASFINKHFGNLSGVHFIDYDELHKQITIVKDEDKIEICALKNDKQYFGKGWKLVSKDNNN